MGGRHWSDDDYKDRAAFRLAKGVVTFAHDADVHAGKASGIHATLNPHGVALRESRDSDVHPEAVPVAVPFDVTGSMASIPRTVQQKLPQLMGLLLRQGYLKHPAIMIGAVGDATCDKYPIQIGQFESDIAIEENLTNLILEEGGGGQKTESYELLLYFLARHTAHDHWDKRGKLGYAFIIGDEMPYATVSKHLVKQVFGDTLQDDIPTGIIADEVKERYHLFYILPRGTNYYHDREVEKAWRDIVGDNFIKLQDPEGICECIAAQIAIYEDAADTSKILADLDAIGSTPSIKEAIGKTLAVTSGQKKSDKGIAQQVPTSGVPSGLAKF